MVPSKRGLVTFVFFRLWAYIFIVSILIFASLTSDVLAQSLATTLKLGTASTIVGIKNGADVLVDVKIANQTNPAGLAAFGFKINYDPSYVSLADANSDFQTDAGVVTTGPFLSSSGRQALCSAGYIDPDEVDPAKRELSYGCVTLGPTPAGAMGSGVLASVKFKPGSNSGLTALTLKLTELVDNSQNTNLIPHTVTGVNIRVARCADYDNNGIVLIPDILSVVRHYGTEDPLYDLDNNGIVLVPDIVIAVLEYGIECTAQ